MEEIQRQRRKHHALSIDEKLTIVHLYLFLKKKKADNQPLVFSGQPQSTIPHQVGEMLGYGHNTVDNIFNEYMKHGRIDEAKPPGNRAPKRTRVPDDPAVLAEVHQFVRTGRGDKRLVTARDLLDHLLQQKLMHLPNTSKKAYRSAHRAVQRYVRRKGMQRGVKKGKLSFQESEKLRQLREQYLHAMAANRAKDTTQQLRELYMDESYVHHHYHSTRHSLYAPDDPQYSEPRHQWKGRRYCFIGAIIGADPNVRSSARGMKNPSKQAHFITEVYDQFVGGKQKDYHGVFNSIYFVGWFQKLLDHLDKIGAKCIISMDNAIKLSQDRADRLSQCVLQQT
jgi:hypothetical protein